jgi:predicted nucleic acid-binding protein
MLNGACVDKIKSAITVVCDAGPAIHLDELGCLELLKDFQEILLPNTVWEEVNRYRPAALNKANLPFVQRPGKPPSSEPLLTLCKVFSLDAGEIEALALMEQRPQAIFLTDDAAARLVAIQMGFNVHGTIGILVRSIRRGQKSPKEVLDILKDIPLQTTLYIRHSLLQEIQLKIKSEFNI